MQTNASSKKPRTSTVRIEIGVGINSIVNTTSISFKRFARATNNYKSCKTALAPNVDNGNEHHHSYTMLLPDNKIGNNKNNVQRGDAQPFASEIPAFWEQSNSTKIDAPEKVHD